MYSESKIIRFAKPFGNGAHVFVPKEWIGEEIVLVKPEVKSIKEKILSVINEHLDCIIGVYLYGSHARFEQDKDSDIDLLIIANKKINLSCKGFEILCLDINEFESALKLSPLLIYSILSESKPIINSSLLRELKSKHEPKLDDFRDFLSDTRRIIKINEDFLKFHEGIYLSSEAIIYSLVLRLRAVFILKAVLSKDKYTNKKFISWIKAKSPKVDFDLIYSLYKKSKIGIKIRENVKVEDIKILLEFLNKEVLKFNNG